MPTPFREDHPSDVGPLDRPPPGITRHTWPRLLSMVARRRIRAATHLATGSGWPPRSVPTPACFAVVWLSIDRCPKGVDPVLDSYPKLVAIDEQADHQVVHGRRFGKANGTTYKTLDPCSQIDVFALDFLRMLFADVVLLGVDMPLVDTPAIRVKPGDAKRSMSHTDPMQMAYIGSAYRWTLSTAIFVVP